MKTQVKKSRKLINLDEKIRYDEIGDLELELSGRKHTTTRIKRSLYNLDTYRDLIPFGETTSEFSLRFIVTSKIGKKSVNLLVEHLKRIGFFELIKTPVPPLTALTSKVKGNKNFQNWKTALNKRIEVGSVLAVDELGDVLKKANIGDFDQIYGDEVSFGFSVPVTQEWVEDGILFFVTGPSMPIQWIENSSWPEEVDPNKCPSPICCLLKKENEAELYLSESSDLYYFEPYLPEKVKSVFYDGELYDGVEGTWEEMVKLFFELQDEIKRLTEAPELPEDLK